MRRSKEKQVVKEPEAVAEAPAPTETATPAVQPEQSAAPAEDRPINIVEVHSTAGGQVEVGKEQITFTPAPDDLTSVKSNAVPLTPRQMTRFEEELEAGRRAVRAAEEQKAWRTPAPKSPVELQIEATTPVRPPLNPAEHIPSMFSKGDKERGHRVLGS